MKKFLVYLTVIISLFGITEVKADTIDLIYSDTVENSCTFYYTDYENLKELGFDDEMQEIYNSLIESYESYSSLYPYYYLDFVVTDDENCNAISETNGVGMIYGFLNIYMEPPTSLKNGDIILTSSYDVNQKQYELSSVVEGYGHLNLFNTSDRIYNPLAYFMSNFDLVYEGSQINIIGNKTLTINDGDIIEPIYSAENPFQDKYTEINLNNYAYVAIALKDYNREAFNTTMYFKGQICLSPIYDHGMIERKEVLTGTFIKRCNPYYEAYTPVNVSILETDLTNVSIYYLKGYDTSKDNYVKIDTSLFDVTYINEESKDNPYVYVQGKYYPTIPYDELTDSASISEKNDYIDGAVEQFNPIGTAFDTLKDILEDPIEWLKDLWSAIFSIFNLITVFINLLPPVLRNMLNLTFIISVSLGIIKIMF